MTTRHQIQLNIKHPRIGRKVVFYALLLLHYMGRFQSTMCKEFSEGTIQDMIQEDEAMGIYRLEHKHEIKHFPKIDYEELKIFCHHGTLKISCSTDLITYAGLSY